jgi:PAS domain S-box-containing protein
VQHQARSDLANDGEPAPASAARGAHGDDLAQIAQLLTLAPVGALVRSLETDVITYWSQGAEQLYGWTASEALGQVSHAVLQTRFPTSMAEVDASLKTSGQWSGELVHTCRDGTRVGVASRQVVRRDQGGRAVATLELNTDLTQHKGLESDLRDSDERFRLENLRDRASQHDTAPLRNSGTPVWQVIALPSQASVRARPSDDGERECVREAVAPTAPDMRRAAGRTTGCPAAVC